MKTRLALTWLLLELGVEIVGILVAARDHCAVQLRDSWPLSTPLVVGGALLAYWLLGRHFGHGERRIVVVLLLVAIGLADIVQARFRSRLGSLALGGVEALVRTAHATRNEERAIACLHVVGTSTYYGPAQARTFIRHHYEPPEQARLLALMTRAVPWLRGPQHK